CPPGSFSVRFSSAPLLVRWPTARRAMSAMLLLKASPLPAPPAPCLKRLIRSTAETNMCRPHNPGSGYRSSFGCGASGGWSGGGVVCCEFACGGFGDCCCCCAGGFTGGWFCCGLLGWLFPVPLLICSGCVSLNDKSDSAGILSSLLPVTAEPATPAP